jgi:hypothetical protein
MYFKGVTPSLLPSLMLPCQHCGDRMTITGVTPAQYPNGTKSNDLVDITHGCVQCGTTLIRTVRSRSGDTRIFADQVGFPIQLTPSRRL